MKLQRQPNRWSCLPTALAMLLDAPVERVIKYIGHDGSEIIFKELPEPLCRRGFNIQEIIDVALLCEHALVPIDALPASGSVVGSQVHKGEFVLPNTEQRFLDHTQRYHGIIIGEGKKHRHAWAWDRVNAYDPSTGLLYDKDTITIETLWALIPLM